METIGRDLSEMQGVPLAATHVAALRMAGVDRRYPAGTFLARAGETVDRFVYVEGGDIEVVDPFTGERHLPFTLGPTQFMGEISILNGGNWSMSMRAVRDTTVVEVPRLWLSPDGRIRWRCCTSRTQRLVSPQIGEPTMSVYWLSFHIHDGLAGGKSYSDRYGSLIAAIKKEAPDAQDRWEKTSAFVVRRSSNENCVSLAKKLSAGLNKGHDTLLIRKMESRSAAIFGLNKASNLVNLMLDGDKSYLIDITPPTVQVGS